VVAADVAALLRARNPLLWIVTREEARVEGYLFEAAAAAGFELKTWDVAAGVRKFNGDRDPFGGNDIESTLAAIDSAARGSSRGRNVWVLRDAPAWLNGLPGAAPTRALRNLARSLPAAALNNAQAVVILTPSGEVPPELAGHATVIEWPMPDREEIAALLDASVAVLPEERQKTAVDNLDAAVDAAVGLSGEEAQACFAKSLVQFKKVVPAAVAQEKRRVIARERVLEWFEPLPGGIKAVGGLASLKAWLTERKLAYSAAAREYGLPAPKGALLVGPPGTGKSHTAKAIATAWGVPLLKMDLGALKSKFVGDSEANIRKAFAVIEAIGRCVVWLDEIEKALAGATQGAADGGVSSDALGAILNWMQERQGEAFVLATSNDAEALPPELMRKGRFDEVWFVDLPNPDERADILQAALRAYGRKWQDGYEEISDLTDGFTGSEIAALVPDALFRAFADDQRDITAADLVAAAKTVVPLSRTAADKIGRLREWAKGKARPANAPFTEDTRAPIGRVLDI
jgi:hypothetical protein